MNQQQLNEYPADKKIANYQFSFKAKIGRGSYGVVYYGINIETNQPVALKVIDKKLLISDYANSLILSEIEIMKQMNHPNIVKLLNVLHTVNNTYIITEFCNGGDLREYLKKKKILSEQEALMIFKQMLIGLKELMNNQIIHRDIKPANILLQDNTFKLTDFGFAKQVPSHCDAIMNSIVGTPLYMSPQILKRQPYSAKCDIWSLGLILYEMLYGITPWHSESLLELIQKIESKPLHFPNQIQVSEKTKELIKACLQIQENRRISIDQLLSQPAPIKQRSYSNTILYAPQICQVYEKRERSQSFIRFNNTQQLYLKNFYPTPPTPVTHPSHDSSKTCSNFQSGSTQQSNKTQENEIKKDRIKRTNSLHSQFSNISFFPERIQQVLKLITNQLDLIPNHFSFKPELETIISKHKNILSQNKKEKLYYQIHYTEINKTLKEILDYANLRMNDNFIKQLFVMILLLINYIQIINHNILTGNLNFTKNIIQQITENSQIQKNQLIIQTQDLQNLISQKYYQ